jgi:adenosylmethionine-8-amino-7-oxononanoate aminotransferase
LTIKILGKLLKKFVGVKNLYTDLIKKDLNHIWHPCSQMKDYDCLKLLHVVEASGSYLTLDNGNKVIDAISSWWCKSLGHGHPRLKLALNNQLRKFEHVILAGTTNAIIVELAEKLASLTDNLTKVFFAGDGSCAIEIAIKLSIHARMLMGQLRKNKFVVLTNGYHGETIGALSLTDLEKYKIPYKKLLFEPIRLSQIPYVCGIIDPVWSSASDNWEKAEKFLNAVVEEITAIVVEPIVQGAAGMKIYSKDFLHRLWKWARKHDVYFIADEIMTGIGRTGKMLASEHADIIPDMVCLSKGLTSGWLPFSAVLLSDDVYQLFYNDYCVEKSFLHSHTYCGNALAAAVALETLKVIEEEQLCSYANKLGAVMYELMQDLAKETQKLTNVRQIGAIVAADLIATKKEVRLDFAITKKAMEFGALLRPLGSTLYWLPPLNTTIDTLVELKNITKRTIQDVYL